MEWNEGVDEWRDEWMDEWMGWMGWNRMDGIEWNGMEWSE